MIIFPLLSRFPTNMAYGVTTEQTANALRSLGYKVLILTSKKDEKIFTEQKVVGLCKKSQFLILNSNVKNLVGIRLTIFTLIYGLTISFKYRHISNLFWTRDLLLSLILSFTSSSFIVCEIHRKPSKIGLFYLFVLKKRNKVLLAVISSALRIKLGIGEYESVIAPMSVNSKEIEYFSKIQGPRKKKIVYLGNLFSGTHKLNVNLINELAHQMLLDFPDWTIEVIGINKNAFKSSCLKGIPTNLRIIERLGRQEIMIKLSESRIGLVIYPNNEYFHDSFPIKIAEYAAAKLAIVASDTVAHRNILDESRCVYFKSDCLISLKETLARLINDDQLQLRLSQNASKWVSNLTYENRVNAVLKQLEIQYKTNSVSQGKF